MTELLEKLGVYGADIKGAMARFLDDEELYASCYAELLVDPSFEELKEAIALENYEKAFDAAHTLKGVVGNMGLTPIYETTCTLVEALRCADYSDLQALYAEIFRQYELLKQLES